MNERAPSRAESANTGEKYHRGPVIACVGDRASFGREFADLEFDLDAIPVDWFGSLPSLDALDQRHPGRSHTYVMSKLDATNKVSRGYANCTGFVALGYDARAGENVSILSHQNPGHFLKEGNRDDFERHLAESIGELLSRTESGTIDISLFGGNWYRQESLEDSFPDPEIRELIGKKIPHWDEMRDEPKRVYGESIAYLGRRIEVLTGTEPHVLMGPNTEIGKAASTPTDVLLDTAHRRLYMIRPIQSTASDLSFKPSEISVQQFSSE